jgi:predicted membrane-bound dolichyl-phosphate-mannose-protein mannosyltransferase
MAGSVTADTHKFGPTRIEENSSSFYSKFLTKQNPQSYGITVEESKKITVKIHSNEGVSVKIYLPDGGIKEYRSEKYFNFEFHAAGEYIIQLKSSEFSKYTLQVSTK